MPEESSNDYRLETLLSKLVDETIEEEELLRLEQQLDGSPEAQSYYLQYLDLHSELDQRGGGFEAPKAITQPKRLPWLHVATTALAAVIAIAGLILFQDIDDPRPIVHVVASGGPVEWEGWNGETRTGPQSGDGLSPGTIETLAAESWIEFAFPDGTTASLSGPSVLTVSLVEGRKVLRLRQGNLSVDAARQPQDLPMRVFTASAETEVLGTQFNIQADSFSTQLTVNEGKVRMKRLADGKIEDVSANQELVAALETGTSFSASPHPVSVHSWKSNLTTDAIQGNREKSPSGVEGIRAAPHIWKGEPNSPTKPILLYSAVFDPSPRKSPPLQIQEGARIEISGRMNHSHHIHPGFATNLDHGGFAGKYAVFRGTLVEVDENCQFQIVLPVSSFAPTSSRFPPSSLGQEMMYLWIQTVKSDAGLVIESVEVKK